VAWQLVVSEIQDAAPTALQAVKLLALYMAGEKVYELTFYSSLCLGHCNRIHFTRYPPQVSSGYYISFGGVSPRYYT
jgi:hypothetical protein